MDRAPKVFVVDDEWIISWSSGMILRSSGFEVYTFTDPHEALRMASEINPDLLITDVHMPDLSGIEVAIGVTSQCAGCKVLLVSGFAATLELLCEARRLGHDFKLLQKPVPPSVLIAAAKEVLGSKA